MGTDHRFVRDLGTTGRDVPAGGTDRHDGETLPRTGERTGRVGVPVEGVTPGWEGRRESIPTPSSGHPDSELPGTYGVYVPPVYRHRGCGPRAPTAPWTSTGDRPVATRGRGGVSRHRRGSRRPRAPSRERRTGTGGRHATACTCPTCAARTVRPRGGATRRSRGHFCLRGRTRPDR